MSAQTDALNDLLSGAPRAPTGPTAQDLLGWKSYDNDHVCSHCAGRIMERGFVTSFRGWVAVWVGGEEEAKWPGCDLKDCRRKPEPKEKS